MSPLSAAATRCRRASTRSGDCRQIDRSWPASAVSRRAAPRVRASSSPPTPLKSERLRTSSSGQSAPDSAALPRAPRSAASEVTAVLRRRMTRWP